MPGWKGAEEIERLIEEQAMPIRDLGEARYEMRKLAEENTMPDASKEFAEVFTYLRNRNHNRKRSTKVPSQLVQRSTKKRSTKVISVRFAAYIISDTAGETVKEYRAEMNRAYPEVVPDDAVAYTSGGKRLDDDAIVTGNIEFYRSNAYVDCALGQKNFSRAREIQGAPKPITIRFGVYTWNSRTGRTVKETLHDLKEQGFGQCIPDDAIAYLGMTRLQDSDIVIGNIEFHLNPTPRMCNRCGARAASSDGNLCFSGECERKRREEFFREAQEIADQDKAIVIENFRAAQQIAEREKAEAQAKKDQEEGEQLLALASKTRWLPLVCMGCGHVLSTFPDGSQACTFCHSSGDRWQRELDFARRHRQYWKVQYFTIAVTLLAAITSLSTFAWSVFLFNMITMIICLEIHLFSRHAIKQSQQKYNRDRDRPYEELYEQALYELDSSLTVWRPISPTRPQGGPGLK